MSKIARCKIKTDNDNESKIIHQIIFNKPVVTIFQFNNTHEIGRESLYEYNEIMSDKYKCPLYYIINSTSSIKIMKIINDLRNFFSNMSDGNLVFDFDTKHKKEEILCKLVFVVNIDGDMEQLFTNLLVRKIVKPDYYKKLFNSTLVYLMFRGTTKNGNVCGAGMSCKLKKNVEYFLKFNYSIIHEAICNDSTNDLLEK